MLCKTFMQLAIYTWTQIRRSRSVNYQLKEETLTDMIILELKRRFSSQIFTKEFTKPQEGVNGADWEWWFNSGSQWIGFRVQAKIINSNSNEFEHLHYRNRNTGIYQCDKLIQNALAQPIPRIPLYCLYLQTPDLSLLTNWICGTYPQNRRLWGCSLISAFEVKKLRSSNLKHLANLEAFLRPWHCLVCCSGFGGNSKVENINSYWQRNFEIDETILQDMKLERPNSFITDNPPNYVLQLLKNEQNSDVQAPDEELDGVIVFRLNE
jgi:hypothetical protein